MTAVKASELLIQALQHGHANYFEELATALSPNVEFVSSLTSPVVGAQDVTSQLQRLQAAGRFSLTLEWDERLGASGQINVQAKQPLSSQYSKYAWDLALDAQGKIRKIVQTGDAQTEPLPPSPILLSDHLDRALKHAFETLNPLIVAYVNDRGQSSQSPRGTVQIFSETQIAMWLWSRNGGLARAIDANPNISVHYWGGIGTAYGGALLFQGVAHIDDAQATRDFVYDNSPPSEQRADPNRAGCALVVDLYRASGFVAGIRFNMESDFA